MKNKVSLEVLLERTGSVYKLCNLAGIRAMELNSGFKQLIETDPSEKITSIAIREIAENKVRIKAE